MYKSLIMNLEKLSLGDFRCLDHRVTRGTDRCKVLEIFLDFLIMRNSAYNLYKQGNAK